MPSNENEEFEFRLRAEKEAGPKSPAPADTPAAKPPVAAPDVGGKYFDVLPKAMQPFARGAVGAGEMGLASLTGAVAPAVGIARSIASGKYGTPEGVREAQQTTGYQPRTVYGQGLARGVGETADKLGLQALAPVAGLTGELGAMGRAAPPVARAVGDVAGAIKAPGMPSAIKNIAGALGGTGAQAVGAEAQAASRGALSDISKVHGATQAGKMSEAFTLEDVSTRLQRELDASGQRGGRPTLDKQGDMLRSAVSGSYDVAKAERTVKTKDLYAKAEQAATAREKDGARIDVSTVTPKVEKMLELAENIPDLQSKLGKLITAVTGAEEKAGVAAPIGGGKVSSRITPTKTPLPPKPGLTYQELDLANKYLKDIAYSGEMQGYDSIVRRAALDLSKGLDTQIAKFVPEHAHAASEYARLSEPLESFATRIGKAVTSTEGGIKGDSYAKIASQNLPQKLFGTRDGVDLVVDALAGGKKGAARAAAQAKVDQMVEHWIMEGTRGAEGRVGAGAAKQLATPQMQATMQAVPSVGKRVTEQLGREAGIESKIAQAGAGAKTARGEAEIAASAKAKVDRALAQADVDFTYGSKKAAYDGYVAALRQTMVGDPERYKAAIALIERAGTLQAKTDKARSLAKKIAGYGTVATIGYEAKGLVK